MQQKQNQQNGRQRKIVKHVAWAARWQLYSNELAPRCLRRTEEGGGIDDTVLEGGRFWPVLRGLADVLANAQ